ncbi:MAG TPA: hypothetical protein VF144_05175 [Chitinophagaceae bacterium]
MDDYLKLSEEEKEKLYKQFLQDPDSFYRKASEDQMKKNLQQDYTERFLTMTRLMKINLMFSKAKVYPAKFSSNTHD